MDDCRWDCALNATSRHQKLLFGAPLDTLKDTLCKCGAGFDQQSLTDGNNRFSTSCSSRVAETFGTIFLNKTIWGSGRWMASEVSEIVTERIRTTKIRKQDKAGEWVAMNWAKRRIGQRIQEVVCFDNCWMERDRERTIGRNAAGDEGKIWTDTNLEIRLFGNRDTWKRRLKMACRLLKSSISIEILVKKYGSSELKTRKTYKPEINRRKCEMCWNVNRWRLVCIN